MADDISKVLETIGSQSKNVDQLTKSLEKLSAVKKDALAAGDVSSLLAYSKMEKSIKRLMVATDKYTDAQNTLKKAQEAGVELSEEQLQAVNAVSKEYNEASRVVKDYQKVAVDAHEKIRQKVEQNKKETTEYWKANTKMGQGWELASSTLSKYTAGLTFSGLAMKALSRHVQATELRQNILIQSNQGLDKAIAQNTQGISGLKDHLVDSAKATAKVTEESLRFSDAMTSAEATAVRMGVSTEVVGQSMESFSKIVGTKSPEMLGKLTQGAITVSRAMGITTAEAVDFVALRMDKFGGSAAGAIVALNQMRKGTESTNAEFGRTVVRSADVVKTLSDISRQTNMYAIDQRFVGNILRDNSARLQANGDSYEMAQKKAQSYTKAVTGEAPEWMQVYAGIDVFGQIAKGMKGDKGQQTLDDAIGAELEAAKPGLKKEIEGIMNDPSMAYYDKMRLVQEMASGTTLGVSAMNKQIMKLAQNPHGLELIAKQFNVSRAVAAGMITQAKDAAAAESMLGSRLKMNNAELAESLKMDEDKLKKLYDINASEADRKKVIQSITQEQSREQTVKDDIARLAVQDKANEKAKAAIRERIEMLKKTVAQANADSDSATAKHATKLLEESQDELSRYEAKETKEGKETEGLKTVEEIDRAILSQFKGYSDNTGRTFQAMLTEMSSTKMLVLLAAAALVIRKMLSHTQMLPRIADLLAKRSLVGGTGEGGEEGGGKGGDGAEKKEGKWKGRAKKLGAGIKKHKGKLALGAAGLAAAYGAYKYFGKDKEEEPKDEGAVKEGEVKEGEIKPEEGKEGKGAETGGIGGMLGGAGTVASGIAGSIADFGGGEGLAKKGLKMAMGAAKLTKAIPLAGNVVAAGFAVKQAWDLFSKWKKDPTSISTSDKIKMATSLAGMIPGIGNAIAMADTAVDMTGGYDMIDDLSKQKDKLAKSEVGAYKKTAISDNSDTLGIPKLGDATSKTIADKGSFGKEALAKEKMSEDPLDESKKLKDYLASTEKTDSPNKLALLSKSHGISLAKAQEMADTAKQANMLPKQTKAPSGTIPANTAAALKVSGVTTAEATQMASDARAQQQANQATPGSQAATAATSGDSGGMSGSFVGGIGGDGSVMLKVDNFMQVMAQATGKIKGGTRGPG